MRPSLRPAAAILLFAGLALRAALLAQPAHRVKDIDTASEPAVEIQGALGSLDSSVLFGAGSPTNPSQIWRSDGTPEGTVLVRSLPGAGTPQSFVRLGADLFFFPNTTELWKSDGTTDGTSRVASFAWSHGDLPPRELTELNGALYFFANDGEHGDELWRSDGTSEGTQLLTDLFPGPQGSGPSSMTKAGGALYFFAADAADSWLWKSDGTAAGTVHVAPLDANRTYGSLMAVDSGLLFYLTQQSVNDTTTFSLGKSDGTAAGTALVRDFAGDFPDQCIPELVCPPYGPSELTALGANAILLIANDGVNGRQLWRSDGTAAGTQMVTLGLDASGLTRFGDGVYFAGTDAAHGLELWRTDGTGPGTMLVKDTLPGPGDGAPGLMTVFQDRLYFYVAMVGTSQQQLWSSDGTEAGTRLLKTVGPRTNGNVFFAPTDGALFFPGGAPNEVGLWKTDGTEGGTVLVSDFATSEGSSPFFLTDVDGRLFFSVQHPGYPRPYQDLWTSDGTETGTVQVSSFSQFAPNTIDPAVETAVLGGRFFFDADDGLHGVELWSSDGTAAGTHMVRDIATSFSNSDSYPGGLTRIGSTLFFAANDGLHGFELWKTDGSASGTVLVKDIRPGEFGSTDGNSFFAANGLLFFNADDGVNGPGLWRSDGTAAGTVLVKVIDPVFHSGIIYKFVALGGDVLFIAWNPNEFGLWSSDGTQAGTRKIVPLPQTASPFSLTASGGLAYFTDDGGALWRSDGTEAGTYVLRTYSVQTGGTADLNDVGGRLLFTADDGIHGRELWTSDGTSEGTVLVADINPGAFDSSPTALMAVDGLLLFAANDGTHGSELWRSDGTAAGTRLVQDIAPGSFSSSPSGFTKSGDLVYFSADDGTTGTELWAIPLAALAGPQRFVEPVSRSAPPPRTLAPRD